MKSFTPIFCSLEKDREEKLKVLRSLEEINRNLKVNLVIKMLLVYVLILFQRFIFQSEVEKYIENDPEVLEQKSTIFPPKSI